MLNRRSQQKRGAYTSDTLAHVQKLLADGASARDARDEETGNTALHFAVNDWAVETDVFRVVHGLQDFSQDEPEPSEDMTIIEALVKAGADVNAQNKRGEAPLHLIPTAHRGGRRYMQFLIKQGADVTLPDNGGWSFLTRCAYAPEWGHWLMPMALWHARDVNKRSSKRHMDVKQGTRTTGKCGRGSLLWHLMYGACKMNSSGLNYKALEQLVNHPTVDFLAQGGDGESPLSIAESPSRTLQNPPPKPLLDRVIKRGRQQQEQQRNIIQSMYSQLPVYVQY